MNSDVQINRLQYVDRLRGLAVLGMFVVHSPYPWISQEVNTGAFKDVISYLSGMVAPVFLFLAGISVCLVAQKARDRGLDGRVARKQMIIRGLGIILAGYGLQLLFWIFGGFAADPIRIFKVDILHCIGASLALFSLLAWPKESMFNWRGLAIFLIVVFGAQLTWRLPLDDWMPNAVAGYFTHIKRWARFPIFPYGGWMALGLVVGPIWIKLREGKEAQRKFWIGFVITALVLIIASRFVHVVERSLGDGGAVGAGRDGFRTSIHYFLYKMAWLFLIFTGAKLTAPFLDRAPMAWLTLFGRVSLFAYCVHLSLIYYGFGVLWKQSLTLYEWALAVTALAVLMFGLCSVWFYWPPRKWKGLLQRALRLRGV